MENSRRASNNCLLPGAIYAFMLSLVPEINQGVGGWLASKPFNYSQLHIFSIITVHSLYPSATANY